MIKQVIVVRKDLKMRKGKIAAQAAHASLGMVFNMMQQSEIDPRIYLIMMPPEMKAWKDGVFTKICVSVNSEDELIAIETKAKEAGVLTQMIEDDGTTEFHGVKTKTCLAIGPAEAEKIDTITGNLPLY